MATPEPPYVVWLRLPGGRWAAVASLPTPALARAELLRLLGRRSADGAVLVEGKRPGERGRK
jgi:hypothetical protein